MNLSPLRRRPSLLTVLAGLLFTIASLEGASAAATSTTEDITLSVGSIFEILAAVPSADSSVSWTLLREDGSFVQADRGRIFHERFVETGNYTLKAEVGNAASPSMSGRTFLVHVSPAATPLPPTPGIMTGAPIVQTDPPVEEENNVVLGSQQTILLSSLSPGTTRLSLDLDGTIDNNRDGNPTNDTDNEGTFFFTDGTPLRIWFPESFTDRTLTITSTGAQGTTVQTLRVTTNPVTVSPPDTTPTLPSTGGTPLISVDDRGKGVFGFSVKEDALSPSDRALLFLWDFGDGRQSMLDRPVHSFASNKSFTVRLTVRDLKTAQEVLDTSGTLQVTSVPATGTSSASSEGQPASSAASSLSSASSAQTSSTTTGVASGTWRTIGMILLVVVFSLIFGFLAMFLVAKIVKQKLSSQKETHVVQKSRSASGERKSASLDHAPPMAVIDVSAMHEEPPPRKSSEAESTPAEKKPKEEALSDAPLTTLQFDESQAPSWLKQAHEEATRTGHTLTTPPPPTLREETPSSSSPLSSSPPPVKESSTAPEPTFVASVPESESEASVPPWLAQASTPPSPPPEPAQEPPPPESPVVPPPPVTAAVTPTPEPAAPSQVQKPAKLPEPVSAPPTQASSPPAEPSPVPPPAAATVASGKVLPEKEISPEERERRKKKRLRYKANKRRREREEKTNGAAEPDASNVTQESTEPDADALEQEMIEEEQAISEPAATETQEPPAPPAPLVTASPFQSPVTPASPSGETKDDTIAIIRADNISGDQKK